MDEEQGMIKELKEKLSRALERADLSQARFYSLMISEINDKIGFNLNAARQRNLSRALAKQEKISSNINFLAKFFMFIMILQMIIIISLIVLDIIS